MITESLISEEVWAEAPEDPEEAFLFIALAAYRRLRTLATDTEERGQFDYTSWRRQYIWELSSVADNLGIGGLPDPEIAVQNNDTMADFDARLARIVTGLRVIRRAALRTDSVALSYQTK